MFHFDTKKLKELFTELDEDDQQKFPFNHSALQLKKYFIEGLRQGRRLLLKEDDATIPKGQQKLKRLYYADVFCKSVASALLIYHFTNFASSLLWIIRFCLLWGKPRKTNKVEWSFDDTLSRLWENFLSKLFNVSRDFFANLTTTQVTLSSKIKLFFLYMTSRSPCTHSRHTSERTLDVLAHSLFRLYSVRLSRRKNLVRAE